MILSRSLFSFAALALLVPPLHGTDMPAFRSAADLATALSHGESEGHRFDFTATVSYLSTNAFNGGANIAASDDSGSMLFRIDNGTALQHIPDRGDHVRLTGSIKGFMRERRFAVLDGCELLNRTTPPKPQRQTLAELTDGSSDYHLSTTDGILTDIAYSSINQEWILLLLRDKTDSIYISAPCEDERRYTRLAELVGTRVRVTGISVPYDHGVRKLIGRLFKVAASDDIRPADNESVTDLSSYPPIDALRDRRPDDLAFAGKHRAEGHVVAVRSDRSVVLRTVEGDFVGVDFAITDSLPAYGDYVEIAGLPDTDLLRINLSHAIWRAKEGPPFVPESPLALRPTELLRSVRTREQPSLHCQRCYAYHGRTLAFTGLVRSLSHTDAATLFVESEGQLIAIDAGTQTDLLENLAVGSEVRVTGTCVLNVGARRANSMLAEISGFTLVLRTPDDLVVLTRPSWWTTKRLLHLFAFALAILVGSILWNVLLNRRAKAKATELAAEQLAHVASELKVSERTRLAVELHDALSQTLTGVSMQIDTAAGFPEARTPAISRCLGLASRTIDACRAELRNTLWDLRSAALDEPTMDAAIRKTLCQNLTGVDLSVRFNVPRAALSDNTAHAVLRIVRELTANALRHGKATAIQIAGTIADSTLRFSVRDNGRGFDPDAAPSIAQGHFGLQGISERLARLDGELTVESQPGKGTKVTIWMKSRF